MMGAALLSFFWATARYYQDAMPLLLVLAATGFWQGYRSLAGNVPQRRLYALVGLLLAGVSITTSTLTALAASNANLEAIRLLPFAR